MPRKGENIYKRKDGRWEGRYFNGRLEGGKKKYTSVYGRTYKEVKEKLATKKSQPSANNPSVDFDTVSKQWLKHAELRVKPSSYANYYYLLEKHIRPYFGKIKMSELSKGNLNKFINQKLENGRLKRKGGISKKYLRDMVSIVKSVASFCEQEYEIPSKIRYAGSIKVEKNEVKLLNTDEQKKLTAYLSENITLHNIGILISLYTGLRLGEVCALMWEDIDFNERLLHIRRTIQRISDNNGGTELIIGTPKTQSSVRTIPIPTSLCTIIENLSDSRDGFVLSGSAEPIKPSLLRKKFKKVLKICKLPEIRYHDLRHLFASNCIRLNFDIKSLSEILGHSNVSMTLNRYVHSSIEIKKRYMQLLQI